MKFKKIKGGVTAPAGFYSHGVSCGIKKPRSRKLDLGLIYSDTPTTGSAGVFTTNKIKAAPVKLCMQHLRTNDIRAIVVNSGNANACTGPRGVDDAKLMAEVVAKHLDIRIRQVLVGSTGIIGIPLPMDRIEPKIYGLVEELQRKNSDALAAAMMTSDTVDKQSAIEVQLGSKKVKIGAVAKGAGMICPNMGTLLCYVTTDAAIGRPELKKALDFAVEHSFNRISIDGDTSTNDTVLVLANGKAGNRKIAAGSPIEALFREALTHLLDKMARKIVADGERVTKFVEILVRNAATYNDAKRAAEAVANSMLIKCSWNGSDPNWGRVIHAVGYSGARVTEEMVDIYFDGACACRHGMTSKTPIKELVKIVSKKEFTVTIDLHRGDADYFVYTTDLSQEYVDYNRSEYAASTMM